MDNVRVNWADFWAACRISPDSPEMPAQLLARILEGKCSFDDKGLSLIGDTRLEFLVAKESGQTRKAELDKEN